jgi:hypothetical protein
MAAEHTEVRMILSCAGGAGRPRAAQPEPIAAAVKATAISATVSARRRPGVNHAGLRAAAHARTPVAAAVAVAAVAMHCAHMRVSMAKPRRLARPRVRQGAPFGTAAPFTTPAAVRLPGRWTRSS